MTKKKDNKWTRRIDSQTASGIPSGIELLGQKELLAKIKPFMKEAWPPFPDTLLIGEPGAGKTTLARYIAQQMKVPFHEHTAPIEADKVPAVGILLLDEAHLQRKPERLFEVMDQNESVTLIAATTQPHKLDNAWRSRFTLTLMIGEYSHEGMLEIARYMLPDASDEALDAYASASGGNPRQMERIATVAQTIGSEDVGAVLETVELTIDGLGQIHLAYLRCLNKMGRAVGLSQVAAMTYQAEDELRAAERRLLDLDLITLRMQGRKITPTGERYIKDFDRKE